MAASLVHLKVNGTRMRVVFEDKARGLVARSRAARRGEPSLRGGVWKLETTDNWS